MSGLYQLRYTAPNLAPDDGLKSPKHVEHLMINKDTSKEFVHLVGLLIYKYLRRVLQSLVMFCLCKISLLDAVCSSSPPSDIETVTFDQLDIYYSKNNSNYVNRAYLFLRDRQSFSYQQIFGLLRALIIQYHIHQVQSLEPILIQINLSYMLPPFYLSFTLNLSLTF